MGNRSKDTRNKDTRHEGKSPKGKLLKDKPSKDKPPRNKPPRDKQAGDGQDRVDESDFAAPAFRPRRPIGLARALMKAGYGTRKQTEAMVLSGRLAVDGKPVRDPRAMVKPDSVILLDGSPLPLLERCYFAFHKPLRVVCTAIDGPGSKLVDVYLPKDPPGLQPAGRLDGRTMGLMLVSNDQAWNNLITQSAALEQEYRVQIEGVLTDQEIAIITAGIHLPKVGVLSPVSLKVVEQLNNRTVVALVVKGGKVRQIRRVFATLRHKVLVLRRVRLGEIRLGEMFPGEVRPLHQAEVEKIRRLCGPAAE